MQQKILPSFALNFLAWRRMSTSENPGQTSESVSRSQKSVGTNADTGGRHTAGGEDRPGTPSAGQWGARGGWGWTFASRRNRRLCPAPAGDWHLGAVSLRELHAPAVPHGGTAGPGGSPSRHGEGGTEIPPDFSEKWSCQHRHRSHCLGWSSPNSNGH